MATTVSKMATTVPNGNDRLRKGKLRHQHGRRIQYLTFIDTYLCCEMQSCSEILLNCVVFPTHQAQKYYIALGCD